MSVETNYFGVDDFVFPVPTGGVTCDYPAASQVRSGVTYGDGAYTGTYGQSSDPQTDHSPADVLRWILVDLSVLGMPPDGSWAGMCNYEPAVPDNCVTLYDTVGNEDGRDMNSGAIYNHPGVQIRVRSKSLPLGHRKAEQIRTALAQSIKLTRTTIDGVTYLVQAITRIGQVIPIGRDVSESTGRFIHTVNCTLSLRKL